MEEEIEQPVKQENIRDASGRFVKGFSGNLKGRPKGQTLKEWARERLMQMDEDERNEFFMGLPKEVIWKMAEGLPQQDITSGGEKINPVPIINVFSNNSNDKDNKDVQEVENLPGRDIGKQNGINPNILDSTSAIGHDINTN